MAGHVVVSGRRVENLHALATQQRITAVDLLAAVGVASEVVEARGVTPGPPPGQPLLGLPQVDGIAAVRQDRKLVVEGVGVSVRVARRARRTCNKKTTDSNIFN